MKTLMAPLPIPSATSISAKTPEACRGRGRVRSSARGFSEPQRFAAARRNRSSHPDLQHGAFGRRCCFCVGARRNVPVSALRAVALDFAAALLESRRMSAALEAIRPVTLAEIKEARARIQGTIVRTPLIRLELGKGYPDIRLKLENLQPINAYKLRGAANAVAMLSESERKRGVWTISAGNAGQGVAYAARQAGVPCSVVAIETAPASKIERMKALGAKLIPVPYDVAWQALEERSFPGVEGTFVHPETNALREP